mgnify:CR=1 FL=1
MTTTAKRDAINSAMSIADDVAAGRLSPTDLDATLAETCKALLGDARGPDDPLFDLQVDIARKVLAAGGLPPGELAEWTAVARRLAEGDRTAPGNAEG